MQSEDAGAQLAFLWLAGPYWIHRRVEGLHMDADGSTRQTVSLDATVPIAISTGNKRTYVPLGLLEKGPLRALDTEGPGGALPVLTSGQNSQLATEMMLSLAQQSMSIAAAQSEWLRLHLQKIIGSDVDEAQYWYFRYLAWRASRDDVPHSDELDGFETLLGEFVKNFMLVVEAPNEVFERRSVFKYSFEKELSPTLSGKRLPLNVGFPVTQFGMAGSWHYEIQAAPELGIRRLEVRELSVSSKQLNRKWEDKAASADAKLVAHVACRPSHRFAPAEVDFVLTPLPRGLFTAAFWGAFTAWIVTVVGGAEGTQLTHFLEKAAPATSAISVVLVGPALLFSWLSRAQEHAITARVLWPLRRLLVGSSASLIAIALLVAVATDPRIERAAWVVIVVWQTIVLRSATVVRRNVRSTSYTATSKGATR